MDIDQILGSDLVDPLCMLSFKIIPNTSYLFYFIFKWWQFKIFKFK